MKNKEVYEAAMRMWLPYGERFSWNFKRRKILNQIRKYRGCENMLSWSVMHESFYAGVTPYSQSLYDRLTPRMLDVTPDPGIGKPNVPLFPNGASGTYVNQAWLLQEWERLTGKEVDKLDSVYEFGGGFGVMAVVLNRLGFTGEHIIYDFPEVNLLQRWYLAEVGVPAVITDEIEEGHSDLLISIAALSEAPIIKRAEILLDRTADHWLLWYRDRWQEMDNKTFFSQWARAGILPEPMPVDYIAMHSMIAC